MYYPGKILQHMQKSEVSIQKFSLFTRHLCNHNIGIFLFCKPSQWLRELAEWKIMREPKWDQIVASVFNHFLMGANTLPTKNLFFTHADDLLYQQSLLPFIICICIYNSYNIPLWLTCASFGI